MTRRLALPVLLLPGTPPWFPDPLRAPPDGLLAIGGDLSPEWLLHAYDRGIFPWYDEDTPPLWWSPDPRAVLRPERLHVGTRLLRRLRQGRWTFTWDRAFADVVRACGDERPEGTWILPEMAEAYERLHALGHAHSLEVWRDGALVGGVYGVHRGGLFAAESMFHRETDASKAALVACVRSVTARGIELFEVQMLTPHLERLGAEAWPRARYLTELARVRTLPVELGALDPSWLPPP